MREELSEGNGGRELRSYTKGQHQTRMQFPETTRDIFIHVDCNI